MNWEWKSLNNNKSELWWAAFQTPNYIETHILQITSNYIVYWNIFLKDTFIWSFPLLWMMIKCCLKNKTSGFQNNLKSQLFNLCCMLHFSRIFAKFVFLVVGETLYRALCENHNTVKNMDICVNWNLKMSTTQLRPPSLVLSKHGVSEQNPL